MCVSMEIRDTRPFVLFNTARIIVKNPLINTHPPTPDMMPAGCVLVKFVFFRLHRCQRVSRGKRSEFELVERVGWLISESIVEPFHVKVNLELKKLMLLRTYITIIV